MYVFILVSWDGRNSLSVVGFVFSVGCCLVSIVALDFSCGRVSDEFYISGFEGNALVKLNWFPGLAF